MVTLIKTQRELEALIETTNWHQAYVREMHFADSQFEAPESGRTNCGIASLLRLLIALPEADQALEIVSFDTELCSFQPNHDLEEAKSGTVKRRVTELDFGAFAFR